MVTRAAMMVIAATWTPPARAQTARYPAVAWRAVEDAAGGVNLEWFRESVTPLLLGWHVERPLPDGGTARLTEERVEAGVFDPPSCRYRFHDAATAARAGDEVSYRLVLVDLELREWPAPFTSLVVESAEAADGAVERKLLGAEPAPLPRAPSISGNGDRVRITVTNDGLHRLTAAQIATVLAGYNEAQAAQAIAQTNLALSCGGEAVAWLAETNGTALLFFGQAYEDVYTDRNIYFLAPGPGLAMTSSDRQTSLVAADPWFWDTARLERDWYFLPFLYGGVEDDYFVWAGTQLVAPATSWQWTTNVALVDLHPSVKSGTATVHLISGYDGTPALDNHTRLYAAGQLVADQQWAGDVRLAQSGSATNLGGTSVSMTVELRREPDVITTSVLIDALEVRYARRMRALNNQLLFRPEAGTNTLTVRGFISADIRVFEVSDPLRPVAVAATIAQEGGSNWRASWTADPAFAGRFLAVAATSQPERIEGVSNAEWSGALAGAPHLVIAPQAMTNAAAALVTYRSQQGLGSLLVPVEALYDNFSFGRADPRAIPRFLAHARTNWTVPPAYVCLAGDGHLDYHDHFGQALTRPNHVPPIQDQLFYTDNNGALRPIVVGVDNPLADTDGNGDPDLAIGRLPAQMAVTLTKMINRIVAHEAADAWKTNFVMVADKDDEYEFFSLAVGRLAERVPPGITVRQLLHTSSTPVETMRTNFVRALNAGIPLSVYIGHGNNYGLSSPYFFAYTNLATLTNASRSFLLVAGTCLLNDFAQPQLNTYCLGKGFLGAAPGGAVAVWASVAQASLYHAEETTRAILDRLFVDNDVRLGDLIRPALDFEFNGVLPWMVRASVLMGDPGTRIRTHLFLDQTPPAIQIVNPTNGPAYQTGTNRLDLAGTASDSNGIWRVVVRNDRGPVEFPAAGTTSWSIGELPLQEGTNWIRAVAYDSANHSATATLQVVLAMMPPVIRIHSPTTGAVYSTTSSHLDLAGTATDYSGVGPVMVRNSRISIEWPAAGTSNWNVTGLALAEGTNLVSVTVADPYGNSATTALQVVNTAAWSQSEVLITGLRQVSGGLELVWPGVAGHLYRIERAYTMTNRFEPLEPLVLATNEFGIVGLPGSTERQMYFRVFGVEGHED